MSYAAIDNPYPTLTSAVGIAINNGLVYIGVAGLDPETHPQACYWDEAGATPASQPLDVKGGYIVNGTTPAQPYTANTYSIRMYDGLGNVVWYDASASGVFSASDISSPSGSSLVGFIQSGTGAAARTAQDKLREHISVEDFGAAGDGTTADTAAFLAAATAVSAAGGGRVYCGKRYLIDGNLDLSSFNGVSFVGPYCQPDEILPATTGDYDGKQGVLVINGSVTITTGDSCAFEGLIVVRKGLDLPFANATVAAAGVAAFAGTAFTVGGAGSTFRHMLILGFSKAIYSTGFERVRCEFVSGDCTNGIEIDTAYDIPDILGCQFYPFTTVHQSWTTNALLRRSGTAYRLQTVDDWLRLTNCFSYGYFRGFYSSGVDSVTYLNCGADNTSTAGLGDYAGSFGFALDGTCKDVRYIGCQAAAQASGYYYANTAGYHAKFIGSDAWGCSSYGIEIVSGDATILGGTMRDLPTGVYIESAASTVMVDRARFNAISVRPIDASIAVTKVQIGDNDYGDWAAAGGPPIGANIGVPTIASVDPLLLPANGDTFIVTGTTNFGTINGVWAGREYKLVFTGSLTVSDGGASLKMAGNLVTGGAATLNLVGTATNVSQEVGRAVL